MNGEWILSLFDSFHGLGSTLVSRSFDPRGVILGVLNDCLLCFPFLLVGLIKR